jgi:predicted PurR-regulated permease PerM
VLDISIRIGVLAILGAWCFDIVKPFIVPFVWGIIIAVASQPLYHGIETQLGGRRAVAATVFTLLALLVLITPTVMLANTLVETTQSLSQALDQGRLEVPPPSEAVKEWPLIGEQVHAFWSRASENLIAALETVKPQLRVLGGWLLSTAAGAGLGILQFVIAIVIAGVMLAYSDAGQYTAREIATRVSGERGGDIADLAGTTLRGVARGILGVAFIQALLAGIGMLAAGIPGAGLWALIALILSVIQIGVGPVLIPAVIYAFSTGDTVTAVVFMVWSIFVTLLDNILKPILLGRGATVPMLVIFMGAIGGFISLGIIGLFVGAVVLVLGYTLFMAWLRPGRVSANVENARRSVID